jgi:MFS family permease
VLGGVFAYAGFINIIVQSLLMTRANRVASDRTIVVAAFACTAVGFSGIAVVAEVGLLVLFLTPITFGMAFIRTTLTAELSRSVPLNRQGMIMGFNQSLMSSANLVVPLLSGVLIGHRRYVPWALAMAAIATCSAAAAAGTIASPSVPPATTEAAVS